MNKFCFPLLMIFVAHNYAENEFIGFRLKVMGVFNLYEFKNYTNLQMFYRYLQDPATSVVYAEYNINSLNITRYVYSNSNMSELSPCFTCDWKQNRNNKNITTIVCTRRCINEAILDNRDLFSFRVNQTDSYPGCSGILLQAGGQFNFTSEKAESCNVRCHEMLTKTKYLNNTSSTGPICNTTTTALKWSTPTSGEIYFSKTADFNTSTETSENVAPNKNRTDHENNLIPIVIGVVCGLVLIASIIIGVILYRMKKTKHDKTLKSISRNNTQQDNATNYEHTTVESHTVGLETLDTLNNNARLEIGATQILDNIFDNCKQEDLNKNSNNKSHFRVEFSQLNFNNLNDDYMVMSVQTRIDTNKQNNVVDYPTICEIDNKNKNELENDQIVDQIDYAIPQKTKRKVQKVYNNVPVDKVKKQDYAKLHDVRREHTHPYNGLTLSTNTQDVDKEHLADMNATDDNTNLKSPHFYNMTDDEKIISSDNKPT